MPEFVIPPKHARAIITNNLYMRPQMTNNMTGLFDRWLKDRSNESSGEDSYSEGESTGGEKNDARIVDRNNPQKEDAPMDYHILQTAGMPAGTAKMLYVQRVFGDDVVMKIYTGLAYTDFEDVFAKSQRHHMWPDAAAALEDVIIPHLARRKGTAGVDKVVLMQYTYERCDDPRTLTDALQINPRHIMFLAMVRFHTGFSTDYIHDEYTPLGRDALSRCIRIVSRILADILPTPIKIVRAIKGAKAQNLGWLPGGTKGTRILKLDGSHVRICKPGILINDSSCWNHPAIPVVTRMLLSHDGIVLATSDTRVMYESDTKKEPASPPLPDLGPLANKALVSGARPINDKERSKFLEDLDFLGTEGNEYDVGLKFIDRLAGSDDHTMYLQEENERDKKSKTGGQKVETIEEMDGIAERIIHFIPIYDGTPSELNYDLEIACGILNLEIMIRTGAYQDWQQILHDA